MLYILLRQYIGTMLIRKLNFSEVAEELQFCSNSKNSGYFQIIFLLFPDFHFSLSPIELTENRLPRFLFHRRTWFSTLQFYSTPKEERKKQLGRLSDKWKTLFVAVAPERVFLNQMKSGNKQKHSDVSGFALTSPKPVWNRS